MPEALRKSMPVMFLTLVVLISVTLLIFTESFTAPVVEKRLRQQLVDQMVDIFPDINDFDYNEEIDIYTLYNDSGESIGYAFLASGSGYGGDISILVGLEDAQTVKGIIILSHIETPDLGSRITEPSFLDQFIGLNINDVALTQDGGQIDGLTSATISSKAVVNAVKETAMEKIAQLEGVE